METRYQIIRLLADGRFHSGEELARVFGISRAAVWKHLACIRQKMGLQVFAVRGKGYRLVEPLELLEKKRIHAELQPTSRSLLSELEVLGSTDSTNSHLMQRLKQGLSSGHACLAEQQLAGRGRRGRTWVSPFGNNIYLSIHWRYMLALADLGGLSLAAGIAVVKSLEQLGAKDIGLKWPNDVLWRNRKLSGLLLEVSGEQNGPSNVVLGLGLNTRLTEAQGQGIDQPWIDLANVPGGSGISRNRLVAVLLDNLLHTMDSFSRQGLESVLTEWKRYDLYHGKPVTLKLGDRVIEGVHRGIDETGALLLQQQGELYAYHGGEVSLRPT
jgi:BirA family biotin operon repressor/biotin-[acetyl-CoA-carboxylase] ligase